MPEQIICPKKGKAWNTLKKTLGEPKAYVAYFRHANESNKFEIPGVDRAREVLGLAAQAKSLDQGNAAELQRIADGTKKIGDTFKPTIPKQESDASVDTFLDSQNLNPMQRGKAKSVLDAQVARRSGGKIYQGKRSDVIKQMLADGYVPKAREVKAVKDLTGTQSNRMDNRQQADFEKRQAAAGTKTEYTFEKGDGDSIFTVTKQEHDFAKHLQEKSSQSKPTDTPATATAKVAEHIADVKATEGQRPAKEVKTELVSRVEEEINKGIAESESTVKPRGEEYPNEWIASSKNGAGLWNG
jgi:hypothetical protein